VGAQKPLEGTSIARYFKDASHHEVHHTHISSNSAIARLAGWLEARSRTQPELTSTQIMELYNINADYSETRTFPRNIPKSRATRKLWWSEAQKYAFFLR